MAGIFMPYCTLSLSTKMLGNPSTQELDTISLDSRNYMSLGTTPELTKGRVVLESNLRRLRDMLAAEYSSSATYSVGDYVIYQNELYRCSTAITTAETWTAAHWTKTSLSNEVETEKIQVVTLSSSGTGTFSDSDYAKVLRNNCLLKDVDGIYYHKFYETDSFISYIQIHGISTSSINFKTYSITKSSKTYTNGTTLNIRSININESLSGNEVETKELTVESNKYKVLNSEQFYPAYNSTYTYSIGDIVSYKGKFYICISAISTAEAWTAAHWAETNPGTQIVELASGSGTFSDIEFAKVNSLDCVISFSKRLYYRVNNNALPDNIDYRVIHTSVMNGDLTFDTIRITKSTKSYVRSDMSAGVSRVAANQTLAGTEAELTSLTVGQTKYKVPTQAQSLAYLTTAPTADNTDGVKLVVLSQEPATRYEGYLYIITEE